MLALLKHCCSDDEFTFSTQLDFSYFFKECHHHYSSLNSYSLDFRIFPSYFLLNQGFLIYTHPSFPFDFTKDRALIMENVEKSYTSLIGLSYDLYKNFISEPFNQLRFCSAVNTDIFAIM